MQLFERYHFGITVGDRISNVWSVIRLLLIRFCSSIFISRLLASLASSSRWFLLRFKPEILDANWLLEDMEKQSIKIEFLNVPDFFLNEETKEIKEDALVSAIRSVNPRIIIMMICYSQILDLKYLLERAGLFPALRMNQDLNILSNGQILTMNDVQKEFIQTMTHEDHVEKDVIVTGPVGSGKTLLGLEAINNTKSIFLSIQEINFGKFLDFF